MSLTPRQQQNIKNIIASTEMDCGPLDERTKRELELLMTGKLDIETSIANAIKEVLEDD